MKKFLASVLCLTFAMSFAACSRKPEQTIPESSEISVRESVQETQTTAITEAAETTLVSETAEIANISETSEEKAAETSAAALNKKDYIKDKVVKFKIKDEYNKKKKKWTYTTLKFHFPVLLIKSSYADSINKAMDKMIKKYQKEFKGKEDTGIYSTEYIAYLTKDGILSIVLIETSANDYLEFRVYNIDVKTGEKVDNARIARIAGVSNIRKTAMNALQAKYNKEKHFKIKNYKVVKKKGQKKNSMEKDVEKSFGTKRLNDKMKIGLTNEGKIFFISEYETGAGEFFAIYDAYGKDLYYSKNPNLVRK